jgi:hypothetical protein
MKLFIVQITYTARGKDKHFLLRHIFTDKINPGEYSEHSNLYTLHRKTKLYTPSIETIIYNSLRSRRVLCISIVILP